MNPKNTKIVLITDMIMTLVLIGTVAVVMVTNGTQSREVEQLKQQLATAQAKLHGQSADVITCRDLRDMQNNTQITVTGAGQYQGVGPFNGGFVSAWLPEHCYNQ